MSKKSPLIKDTPNNLITTSELIILAKNAGVKFGFGDPKNRIRYFIKSGLLPIQIRKYENDQYVSYIPSEALELLIKIQELTRAGVKVSEIKAVNLNPQSTIEENSMTEASTSDSLVLPISEVAESPMVEEAVVLQNVILNEAANEEVSEEVITPLVSTPLINAPLVSAPLVSAPLVKAPLLLESGNLPLAAFAAMNFTSVNEANEFQSTASTESPIYTEEVLVTESVADISKPIVSNRSLKSAVILTYITAILLFFATSLYGGHFNGLSERASALLGFDASSNPVVLGGADIAEGETYTNNLAMGTMTNVQGEASDSISAIEDKPFYEYWWIKIAGERFEKVTQGDSVNFIPGSNISMSFSMDDAITVGLEEDISDIESIYFTNGSSIVGIGGGLVINADNNQILTNSSIYMDAGDDLYIGGVGVNSAIGDRQYAYNYFIADGESITESLNKLDIALDAAISTLSSGAYTSWSLAGDSGSSQSISNGNTANIVGGANGIDTITSAVDTLTLNLDTTEIGTTTFGSGSAVTWTFDAGATDPSFTFGSDSLAIAAGSFSITDGVNTLLSLADNGTTGTLNINTIALTGTGTLNGLDAIDATGESTLEAALDIAGDVTGTGLGSVTVARINGVALGDTTATNGNILLANGTSWVSTTLNNLITLGTHTSGNYVATVADAGNGFFTVVGSGTENAAVTLDLVDASITNAKLQNSSITFGSDSGSGARALGTTLNVNGGTGVSTAYSLGTLTITNTDRGSSQNIFKTISVSGQSDVVTDSNSDTLTLVAGTNVSITTNATTDAITITSTDTNTTYSAGSGLTLSSTTFNLGGTLTADAVFSGSYDLVLGNAGSELRILESAGATYYGTIDVGDLSADATFTLTGASGNILTDQNAATFLSAWDQNASNDLTTSTSWGGDLTGTGASPTVAANVLDFTEFSNTMALDASTDIAIDNAEVFSLTNTGSGYSFIVNDSGSDPDPFVISANGSVGVGTTDPLAKINSLSTTEQLRLSYDASNYSAFTVSSSGDLSLDLSGGDFALTGNLDASGSLAVGTANAFAVNTSGAITAATGITSSGTIAFSGLGTGTDNTVLILNGSNQVTTDEIDSRVWGSTLLDDTEIGTTVQAYDAQLDDLSGLTPSDGNFIVGNGTNFVAESGNTARTSLGLGTGDSPTFTGVTVSGLTASSAVYTDGSKNLTSTAPTSGALGYWSRTGTTLTPTTSGDNITTTGALSAGAGSAFNVDNSGAITAVASITTTGAYTQSGTGANTFSGSTSVTPVNSAGGSANALTLSGTLGAFNGSDTFRGLYLNYTNANHTSTANVFNGIDIAAITGDADATETAMAIGSGWDNVLSVNGTPVINGSGQIITTQLSGTLFSTNSDSGSSTVVQGDTLAINGGTNGIDTSLSGDTYTLNIDTTEIGTTTFGSGSDFTWTLDAGVTDPTIAFASQIIDLTPGTGVGFVRVLTGNLRVGNAVPSVTQDGEDAYVEGTFEVDGATTLDGALTVAGTTALNGVFTLGDSADLGSVDTSDWDISTTGVLTGISGITTNGGYTQSGSSTNTLTGSTTISADTSVTAVNGAGASSNSLTLSGTLGAMNGSDVFRGLYLNYTNANHTSTSNKFYGINIAGITGDADALESAIEIGSGWDSVLTVNGTQIINSSGQVIAGNIGGTIFNTNSDSGSSTLVQGDTIAINGGTNGIDTVLSSDTYTLNIDATEIGTTTFGSGSDFTWTFNSSGATDPTLAFGNGSISPTLTATGLFNVLTGNLKVGNGTPTLTQNGEDAYIEGTFEVDGVSTFASNVGIGTTNPGSLLEVSTETPAYATGSYFNNRTALVHNTFDYGGVDNDFANFQSNLRVISSVDNPEVLSAIVGSVFVPSGNTADHGSIIANSSSFVHEGTGLISTARGGLFSLSNSDAGEITEAFGSEVQIANSATGIITDLDGLNVNVNNEGAMTTVKLGDVELTNSGTIGSTYGYYVGDITSGTQTNNPYSFYASDANAYNYFAGDVGIGTSTPGTNLQVNGTTGLRLAGTGVNTNTIDLVPGVASSYDRLDFKSVSTDRGISFQLNPNGTSTNSKIALANAASSTVFGSAFFSVEGTQANISSQTVGGGTPVTNLSFGGGSGAASWSNIIFASGNVGIGTTAPDQKLSVTKNLTSIVTEADWAFSLQSDATVKLVMGTQASGGFSAIQSFDPGTSWNTKPLSLQPNGGNVGIGTTAPAAGFHVNTTLTSSGAAKFNQILFDTASFGTGVGGGIIFGGKWNTGGSQTYFGGIQGIKENSTDGNYAGALLFTTRANGSNPSEAMRITSGGKIGIGTTAPGAKLDIVDSSTDPAGTVNGLSLLDTKTLTTNNTQQLRGVYSDVRVNAAGFNNTNHVASYIGIARSTGVSGAGTVTSINSYLSNLVNSGSATVGTAYGYRLLDGTNSGGGTITNLIGYYSPDLTVGTNNYGFQGDVSAGTNKYNLYMSGTAQNYFAGNVGIGTVNPLEKLSLGITYTTGVETALLSGESGGARLSAITHLQESTNTGASGLLFKTYTGNGSLTEKVRITNAGNVGIGTTNPTAKLQVNGSGMTSRFVGENDTSAVYQQFNTSANSGLGYFGVEGNTPGATLTGTLAYATFLSAASSGSALQLGTAGGIRMTINSAGNVGIGNSNPTAKLMIDGSADDKQLIVQAHSTQTANILEIQNSSATPLVVVSGAGNVGIGTTSPVGKLHIGATTGVVSPGSIALSIRDAQSPTYGFDFNLEGVSTGDLSLMRTVLGTQYQVMTFQRSSGNVGIGTTAPDQKLSVTKNLTSIVTEADWAFSLQSDATVKLVMGTQASGGFSAIQSFDPGTSWNTKPLSLQPNGGNVGIGTTAPAGKLEVLDTSNTAASFTLTNNTATTLGNGANTTGVLDLQSTTLTTGNFMNIELNALTTGKGVNLTSTSTTLTTGNLFNGYWNPGSAATATGDLFKLDIGANATLTGNLFALYNNGTNLFSVGTAKITSALPHEFTAAGDVSFAYDSIFTNQTASQIESYGPLTIVSGESFENLDLTLKAYGTGAVVVDNAALELYTGEKLVLDTNDAGDSYFAHNNGGNYVSAYADGVEVLRFNSDQTVDGNSTFDANAFDIAEYYPTVDSTVEAGDVVALANSETESSETVSSYLVAKADPSQANSQVLGIISTKPGFSMGGGSFRSEFCTLVGSGEAGETQARKDTFESTIKESIIKGEFEVESLIGLDLSTDENLLLVDAVVAQLYEEYVEGSALSYAVPQTRLATIEDRINTCKAVKQVPVTLAGRVPVKVDVNNGNIKAGDLLAPSTYSIGKAMKAVNRGWVVGRALEDQKEGSDTVMVYVFTSWYDGGSTVATGPSFNNSTESLDLNENLASMLTITNGTNGRKNLGIVGDLTTTGDISSSVLTASNHLNVGLLRLDALDNSINALGAKLYVQDQYGALDVDFFNGKLVIGTDGSLVSLGRVEAKVIAAQEFKVLGANTLTTSATVGEGTILSGQTELVIQNTNVKTNSKIFVTPTTATDGRSIVVAQKQNGNFKVTIDSAHDENIKFDYWIVQVE